MSVLPSPPNNVWSDAISSSVESLLMRMEAVERIVENIVLQAAGHKQIRDMETALNELNDAMLITPANKRTRKRSLPKFEPFPDQPSDF